uniref:AAA family ATPase n=1 Tax=Aliarcobacter butzleri TaxID=28197 RepID=UPI00125F85E0
MELVYLWVEEYKNIKNQGFNFSPRFECEYDESSNELTIKENKDYVSIFPKNINITAIVGENGSGKTNTIEAIISLLDTIKNTTKYEKEKLFLVYFFDNKYFVKSININLERINNQTIENLDLENNKCFSIYFNYTLDVLQNQKTKFVNLYHRKDNYETPITMLPNKKGNNINIEDIEYHTQNAIVDFGIKEDKKFSQIKDFFIPDKIKIELDKYKIIPTIEEIKVSDFFGQIMENIRNNTNLDDISYIVQEEIFNAYNNSDTTSDFKILGLKTDVKRFLKNSENLNLLENNVEKYSKDDWKTITKLYLISKLKLIHISSTNDKDKKIEELIKNDEIFEQKIKENKEKLLENTKGKTAWEFYQELSKLNENEKPFNFKEKKISIKDNENFVKVLPSFLKCEIFDEKDVSFNSLSYGQKFMMRFAYNLIYQLNKIKEIKNKQKYTSVNLLLDEIEQGLHPDWQKRFINFLNQVLNQFKNSLKFNIIITSHSPFIISDLPKENVIFLEKDKQSGLCKNVTKDMELKTFGANIHTLLSNGFFMSDGLMGEFAKSKIEEIKKFYKLVKKCERVINESEKTKNIIKNIYQGYEPNFRNIQKIIGEPFLQTIIKNYLDEVEQIFDIENYKSNKKQELLKQFSEKELEEFLESLKN